MKKIMTYVRDGGVTLNLRDPLILTHESRFFVKTASVFWNYCLRVLELVLECSQTILL
jgi:hypothetical protein